MGRFIRDPEKWAGDDAMLDDLIYGWGNEGYSALNEFLQSCIREYRSVDGPVLECGSGLSTVILGALADRLNREHWVLEHDRNWAARLQACLNRYDIRSVRMCVGPLKDYGDYSWYGEFPDAMPDAFPLVICDGPPGDTAGGRFGLVPVMRAKFPRGSIILLDDVGRHGERCVADRWQQELGVPYVVHGEHKPYGRFVLP